MIRQALSAALALLAAAATSASGGPVVRVVSLAPSLTELVFDLGFASNLVGRSSACDYPAAAAAIPVAGDFGRPTLEAMLGLKPDLLLVTDVENVATLSAVRTAGIRVAVLPCENWDQLATAARTLATELGDSARGNDWVARLTNRVAGIRGLSRPDTARLRVYVEVWGDPLTTVARDSFVAELIRTAGGENIGDALAGRYATVSAEWVLAAKPDVVLLAYMPASATPDREALARRIGWRELVAVRDNRIIRAIPADLLLRPGPRLVEGCAHLAEELRKMSGPKP